MFLSSSHIPEFPEWMTAGTREETIHDGMNRVSQNKNFAFWMLALLIPGVIWCGLDWLLPSFSWMLRFVLSVVITGFAETPLIAWQRRVFHRSIRAVLRERGVNICTGCGYTLESLERQPRCPKRGGEIASMPPVGPIVHGTVRLGGKTICESCSYDLSGLNAPGHCPECGRPIAMPASH